MCVWAIQVNISYFLQNHDITKQLYYERSSGGNILKYKIFQLFMAWEKGGGIIEYVLVSQPTSQ